MHRLSFQYTHVLTQLPLTNVLPLPQKVTELDNGRVQFPSVCR